MVVRIGDSAIPIFAKLQLKALNRTDKFILGWKAPRASTELVYPEGLNKGASDDELNISFEPSPDYARLAEAAAGAMTGDSWIKGSTVSTVSDFRAALQEATELVGTRKGGMLINAVMARKT